MDFERWMSNVGDVFSTLPGKQKLVLLYRLLDWCSGHELYEFSLDLDLLMKRDFVKLLPDCLLTQLFSHLDVKTLLKACQVCRNWNDVISRNQVLWKMHCLKQGFVIPGCCSVEGSINPLLYKQIFLTNSAFVQQWSRGLALETLLLQGHTKRVTALYYHNGKIATGSDDRSVCIWCCRSGTLISNFSTHSVSAIKFDDCFLVTASFDRTAACWDIRSGTQLKTFVGHTAAVFCVDYSTQLDVLVTGSADTTIKIWSFSEGHLLRTLEYMVSEPNWIIGVKLLINNNLPGCRQQTDLFHVVGSDGKTVSGFAINNVTASVEKHEILFSSDKDRLIGFHVEGFSLTIVSQEENDLLSESLVVKERVFGNGEFSKMCLGVKQDIRYSVSSGIDLCSYLGSGTCSSAFFAEQNERNILCVTRRCSENSPVTIKMPQDFWSSKHPFNKNVILCNRSWMDGIDRSSIRGQDFVAVITNNGVKLLKFKD